MFNGNMACLIQLFLAFFSFLDIASSSWMYPVDCTNTPILAPEPDCLAVLRRLERDHLHTGRDRLYEWGRTVDKEDRSKISLPIGMQLTPVGLDQRNRPQCEIHVDNVVGHESETDRFTMADLVYAAASILDKCYPTSTGYAFPQPLTKNVYATTIYLPSLRTNLQNYTTFMLDQNETSSDLGGDLQEVTRRRRRSRGGNLWELSLSR